MLYLVSRNGIVIPNRKRWAAGSQLPFLSHCVREVYQATRDRDWLSEAVRLVEKEYHDYWVAKPHLTPVGLSRYHALPWFPADRIPAITMDAELSWDLSPRFDEANILNLLPVDLNCNLFTYERNFGYFMQELGSTHRAEGWSARAVERRNLVNRFMWDESSGLYFDYDFQRGQRSPIRSLAAYIPLFSGVADARQADRLVRNLAQFEANHGLNTCAQDYGYFDRQWNHPVGWAPLHWMVFEGLRAYGYAEPACRIALKWLHLNLHIWRTEQNTLRKSDATPLDRLQQGLYEKYDVVRGSHQVLTDRYSNQKGFGWTNAVFHLLTEALTAPNGGLPA